MGSSKKHKEKDREHRRKHKHKDRERSRSRSRSRERKHRHEERHKKREDRSRSREPTPESKYAIREDKRRAVKGEQHGDIPIESCGGGGGGGGGGGNIDLSIEATNKLRAQLGLKPLEIDSNPAVKEDKESLKDDVHKPAVNISDVKKTESLKEKMAAMKEKRLINMKLGKVKMLAESDDDDDSAMAWIKKSRKLDKEKKMAEKRAKMLEEMDAEFGISGLVEEEFGKKEPTYTSRDLKGIKVRHDQQAFSEGRTTILTLADKGVLDDDGDELMNVNIMDLEKVKKNEENKKTKPGYNAYDEPEYDEFGMFKPKNVLGKYDEEIEGEKQEAFTLGSGGGYNAEHERNMQKIRNELQNQQHSLTLVAPKIMSEYYTPTEMETFNKVKKKTRKIRKKDKILKADDLLPLADDNSSKDLGSRSRRERPDEEQGYTAAFSSDLIKTSTDWTKPVDMEIDKDTEDSDILGPEEDLTGVQVEEDEAQLELQLVLNKARKLKRQKHMANPEKLAEKLVAKRIDEEMESEGTAGKVSLNATSEFCRSLGEIPTYGLAGNREEDRDELMDFERELMEERRRRQEEEQQASGWEQVDIDDRPVDIKDEENPILDDEPVLNTGIGAALMLANTKGYLEEGQQISGATIVIKSKNRDILAQNFTMEDKNYNDLDEKFKKRDRFSSGITQDFKEKSNYKPNVDLVYIDDAGRSLNQKEAFRQLSHRFHGKGSGKKKTEKRTKKVEEEQLMKHMSSSDTPLNTVALLQEKQAKEKTPYIVLSGGGKTFTSNPVVK